MHIRDSTALVTGGSRGLGRCIVDELLARGARRVYTASPDPSSMKAAWPADRDRVVPRSRPLRRPRTTSTLCSTTLASWPWGTRWTPT
jgi:NAD(P)-dependent dehydrogenase (short-subunit alcohol dehydrogenase family)